MDGLRSTGNDLPTPGSNGNGEGSTPSVLIVDDHSLFAGAIRATSDDIDMTVSGVVSTGGRSPAWGMRCAT